MNSTIPNTKNLAPGVTLLFSDVQKLKHAAAKERERARREALSGGGKFVRSRGMSLIASNREGRTGNGESLPWDGTLRSLRSFAEQSLWEGATLISVDGGYDASDHFDFADYSPEVSTWSVEAVTLVPASGVLYLRLGDEGDYETFRDDYRLLAERLSQSGIKADDIEWLPNGDPSTSSQSPAGFTTEKYRGYNYVSLFWGDSQGNLLRRFEAPDQVAVTLQLGLIQAANSAEVGASKNDH